MNNEVNTENNQITILDPQSKAERIFDLLDVKETTRTDYKSRIDSFLDFTSKHGVNRNSFLDYKRELAG